MKNIGKIFLLAFVQAGIILALPLFITGAEGETPAQEGGVKAVIAATAEVKGENKTEKTQLDAQTEISLLVDGETKKMSMESYLCGVLSAEMPASFEPEALKAQAAAARTYAIYRVNSGVHAGCVCSDPNCCQAWLSDDAIREKWGTAYSAYAAKIVNAVNETDGVCITYDGEAILAAFHSSSGGYTEDSGNVFTKALPYLISVESPEKAEEVPNYITTLTLTKDDVYKAVEAFLPEAAVQVSDGAILTEAVYSETGRLLRVKLGGETVSGTELRKIFSLRSAMVSWQNTDDGISFTVTGYGHGVGMSQYGANALAKQGAGWEEIISHYYPGTSTVPISALSLENASASL